MVVVVGGHQPCPLAERRVAERGMLTPALPLLGLEPAEQSQRIAAPPPKRLQRRVAVAPRVLTLLDPAFGIDGQLPSAQAPLSGIGNLRAGDHNFRIIDRERWVDRKSTRLNSSHDQISYAVFC